MNSPDSPRLFPDNAWFDGQVASWTNKKKGSIWLFEVIDDPSSFREVVNSPGDPEIVELHDPKPGQTLRIIFVDHDNRLVDKEPVVLDASNPATELQAGDRFIMDATETTALGHLAYTCFCQGVEEL